MAKTEDQFHTSSDLPFSLRGGDSQEVALYNRVAAINRINFLVQDYVPNFDLRQKSVEYLRCLDLELWKKYYEKEPKDKKIDEDFCQRAARICMDMEGLNKDTPPVTTSSDIEVIIQPEVKPKNFFEKILDKLK